MPRRRLPLVLLVAALGLFALGERWVAGRRPRPLELRATANLLVTSSRDAGPGSLREALFAAASAGGRARIELRTARVSLATPLPPLVNPAGIVLDASVAHTELDARAVTDGPALDVAAPGCVLNGFTVRGAPTRGVLVRAAGTRVEQVTFRDCAEGILLAAGITDLTVEASEFEANGVGVRVGPGARRVSLRGSRFARHDQAGVSAVAPAGGASGGEAAVVVSGNRFEGDRIAVVLMNVRGQVEDNQFERAGQAAIYLQGPTLVRRNRIRGGAGIGVFGDDAVGALIEDNEIDHNQAVGILLRHGGETDVRRNRVYGNGYGIAVIFPARGTPNVVESNLVMDHKADGLYLLGSSPIVRDNRSLRNGQAGLRILDYLPLRGARLVAEPLLQDNVFEGNAHAASVRGEVRATEETP